MPANFIFAFSPNVYKQKLVYVHIYKVHFPHFKNMKAKASTTEMMKFASKPACKKTTDVE